MIPPQPWQEELKRIEESSAQRELADQLEREFTRIGAKGKLTKAHWIGIAATMASQLVQADAVRQSIPELATGLLRLGATNNGKAGGKARADRSAQRRSAVAEWLREQYTSEGFAKRGAITSALYEARDKFCVDEFKLSEKTFRSIAIEAGLLRSK
jgi:hypothetical protein